MYVCVFLISLLMLLNLKLSIINNILRNSSIQKPVRFIVLFSFFNPYQTCMCLLRNKKRITVARVHVSLASKLTGGSSEGKKKEIENSFFITIIYMNRYWSYSLWSVIRCSFTLSKSCFQVFTIKQHYSLKPNPVLFHAQRSAFDSWPPWHFLTFSRSSSCQ